MAADGTMVTIEHSDAYRRFRDMGEANGFAKGPPEQVEVFDSLTITTASDAAKQLKFFSAADPNDRTLRSYDPQISYGQAISADILMCVHSVAVELDQQLYVEATTGLGSALGRLSDSLLEIFGNSDRKVSKRVSSILTGKPGIRRDEGATVIAKSELVRSAPYALDVPFVVQGGGTLKMDLWTPAALTGIATTSALKLILHTWLLRRGAPPSDAILSAKL